MSTVAKKLMTVEEFVALPDPPDGSMLELDEGEVVVMPSPKGRHGIICLTVGSLVRNHVRANKLGHVASNDSGVILSRGPDVMRGPDVAYYSYERVPAVPEDYFEIAPDLAVEVVSPDDSYSKLQKKVRQYLKFGVRMVWVIDPGVGAITVHTSSDLSRTLDNGDTLDGGDVLPGFSCKVADFFE